MRVTIRAAALGLLMCATAAAHAPAAEAPRIGAPPYATMAGPVFAGDAVVWGHPSTDGYELIAMRGGERTSTRLVTGPLDRPHAHLEASERRVVLTLRSASVRVVVTGPVGGPLEVLAGCTSTEQCERARCPVGAAADVSGDVVAYADCRGLHVRDLTPDASPAGRNYPGLESPRVAGPFVAGRSAGDTVTVSNWVSDEAAYEVITSGAGFDLQPDGKVVFEHRGGFGFDWESPEQPSPQRVAIYEGPIRARIAGDRIAVQFSYPRDPYGADLASYHGYSFDIVGLEAIEPDTDFDPETGYHPSLFDRWALDRMDFDGERLLWVTTRCRHAWLMTWGGPKGSSAPPPRGCPFPRVVSGSPRLHDEHRLRLRLACDVPRGPACTGQIRRVGREGKLLEPFDYSIAERHAKTIDLPRRGSLCRVNRRRARAQVMLARDFWTRIDEHPRPVFRKLTVTARGPTAGLAGC